MDTFRTNLIYKYNQSSFIFDGFKEASENKPWRKIDKIVGKNDSGIPRLLFAAYTFAVKVIFHEDPCLVWWDLRTKDAIFLCYKGLTEKPISNIRRGTYSRFFCFFSIKENDCRYFRDIFFFIFSIIIGLTVVIIKRSLMISLLKNLN